MVSNCLAKKRPLQHYFVSLSILHQKRLRGATNHSFLFFLYIGKEFQPRIKFFTSGGHDQPTPVIEIRAAQSPQTKGQWTKRCSRVSSAFPQREHPTCQMVTPSFELLHFPSKEPHFCWNTRIPNHLIRHSGINFLLVNWTLLRKSHP